MSEYIDREAFLKDAEIRYCLPCKGAGKDYNGVRCRACWVDDMMGEVDDAPAADVAPVVHGRKIEDGDIGCFWLCSLCGECLPYGANYCPNCGAKMDLEDENNG